MALIRRIFGLSQREGGGVTHHNREKADSDRSLPLTQRSGFRSDPIDGVLVAFSVQRCLSACI